MPKTTNLDHSIILKNFNFYRKGEGLENVKTNLPQFQTGKANRNIPVIHLTNKNFNTKKKGRQGNF